MRITEIKLLKKSGGRSGIYKRKNRRNNNPHSPFIKGTYFCMAKIVGVCVSDRKGIPKKNVGSAYWMQAWA